MSEGTKIALAVLAVGVVGFFIYQETKTSTVKPSAGTAPAANAVAFVSGIVNTFGSLAGKLGGGSAPPQNAPLAYIGVPSPTSSAYQGSSGSNAYADAAGGVLPQDATAADYQNEDVVYGPFLPS
jgi:hypothetical protein